MENTLRSVSHISFFFFCVFGALHLSASMLMIQELDSRFMTLIYQSMDLPFLLAGLVYGTSRLSIHAEHILGKSKIPLIVCGAISAVLFLIALYFNFVLPDVQF